MIFLSTKLYQSILEAIIYDGVVQPRIFFPIFFFFVGFLREIGSRIKQYCSPKMPCITLLIELQNAKKIRRHKAVTSVKGQPRRAKGKIIRFVGKNIGKSCLFIENLTRENVKNNGPRCPNLGLELQANSY